MRLPSLMLSVLVVPAATLVTVAAPVTTPPTPVPRPVTPTVVELPLAADAGLPAAGPTGPRTLVLTEPRSTEPFSTVGVTWAPSADVGEVHVEVRTRGERGWGEWTELAHEDARPEAGSTTGSAAGRDGAGPVWAGRSDGVQVRVDVVSGAAPRDLQLVLVDPGSSPADAAAVVPASTADAQADRPGIRSRTDWGADESMRTKAPTYSRTLEAVTVHHTAGSNDYTEADVPAILRGIYAFHVNGRGWSDIGYNVLVDKFGTAWEGRAGGVDRPVIGAHAGGFNTGTAGISLIGTHADVEPSAASVDTVAALAAWKLGLYGRDAAGQVTLTSGGNSKFPAGQRVPLQRIFSHRDVSDTSCPGGLGYATLGAIRDRAVALTTGAPLVQPFGELDGVAGGPERVTVNGWAVDPDSSEAVQVVPVVDGVVGAPTAVSVDRPDIHEGHRPYPVRSGFAASVAAEPGERVVCATLQNQAGGTDVDLGCRTVTVEPRAEAPPPRAPDDACPDGRVPPALFTDTLSSVHRAAIDCAVWWDLIRGREDGTFGPALALNRGHMALVLARTLTASGAQLPADPPRAFDDLGAVSAEVRLAVRQLAALGVVRGRTASSYDPAGLVTRAQMASFLVGAYEQRTGRSLSAGDDWFTDDDGSVHEPAIGKVAAAGITGGAGGGVYQPDRSTERGQTATFLVRLLDLLVEEGTTARR